MATSLPTLSLDTLISVTYSITPAAAQSQNTTTLLLLTNSTVIDSKQRYALFNDAAEVGAYFGEGLEFSAAQTYFSAPLAPAQLMIGRWLQAAAAGRLLGAPLTPAQQAIANFTGAGADCGFSISIDGAGVEHIGGINLSAVLNLNAVAAAIQTALGGGVTCIWDSINMRFQITSSTTGGASSISFLTAPSGGVTDISGLLGMQAADSGAYVAPGAAAESALACVTLFDQQFGGKWYGLAMPQAADSDQEAIAPFIESGSSRRHFNFVTTMEAGTLVSTSTTDLAYILSQIGYQKTMVQYSSTISYAAVAPAAQMLTVDYSGTATDITLMWKQMPTLAPEYLSDMEVATLQAKNCNAFVELDNNTAIFVFGTTTKTNVFIDTICGADNFAIDCKNAYFNTLYTLPKVSQDDGGMHALVTALEAVCVQYETNGYLAPGTWTGAGFGALQTGQFMETGYYVYAPPVASQDPALRAQRIAVPIQIAAKLGGAIHSGSVAISLNP